MSSYLYKLGSRLTARLSQSIEQKQTNLSLSLFLSLYDRSGFDGRQDNPAKCHQQLRFLYTSPPSLLFAFNLGLTTNYSTNSLLLN